MNYVTPTDLAEYAASNILAMDIWELHQDEESRINAACAQATQIIDRFHYVGKPSTPDHAFPRYGQAEVPAEIKKAACEIALALLDGVNPELEADAQDALSFSVDGVRSTYDRSSKELHILAGIPSRVAWNLLTPWLSDMRSITQSRV